MRLLNARTLQLRTFFGADIPPYAILSHTWDKGEVGMQQLLGGTADGLEGYRKILGLCGQALQDGIEYVWIDTCCIDQTSNVELTEAINSMFNWYRNSTICYAYLRDVISDEDHIYAPISTFARSRWFTRGWTLQELIAPARVVFYAGDWREIGSRSDMKDTITRITGIDSSLFSHGMLGRYSVAQRLSWAAKRETTRMEDRAYSLLGLFGVNMPLLYGEGDMAFLRLQEEIMRRSDDQSLFAWTPDQSGSRGLLASSPSEFEQSGKVAKIERNVRLPPYSITNQGIQITLLILDGASNYQLPFIPQDGVNYQGFKGIRFALNPTSTLALLNCGTSTSRVGIFIDRSDQFEPFYRSDQSVGLVFVPLDETRKASVKTIMIQSTKPNDELPLWSILVSKQLVVIKGLPATASGFRLHKALTQEGAWVEGDTGLLSIRLEKAAFRGRACLHFGDQANNMFCVVISAGKLEENIIFTDLVVNMQPRNADSQRISTSATEAAETQDMEEQARERMTQEEKAFDKRKMWLKEQASAGGKKVAVKVEINIRPHGALVWIFVLPLLPRKMAMPGAH